MAVTEEFKEKAYDLETRYNWKSVISRCKPVGYAYGSKHEPRRYYLDEDNKPCYREVTESEMHRYK